jgi:thiol:disulfide interchange protein DsbD
MNGVRAMRSKHGPVGDQSNSESSMVRSWLRVLLVFLVAVGAVRAAHAQSEDDLLPVEQAFRVTAKIAEPGTIALHWDIAPDYYLYRARIKAKTSQDGTTLGELALPDGTK